MFTNINQFFIELTRKLRKVCVKCTVIRKTDSVAESFAPTVVQKPLEGKGHPR